MMTKTIKRATSNTGLGQYNNAHGVKYYPADVFADTQMGSQHNTVLVKGRYVQGGSGSVELVVSMSPAEVQRKLTIRQMNGQLEGRTAHSDTHPDRKVFR